MDKRLTWKNVKQIFICSLHFEAKCFENNRLDFKKNIEPTLFKVEDVEIEIEVEKPKCECSKEVEDLKKKLSDVERENFQLKKSLSYYKRKSKDLSDQVKDLKTKLTKLKEDFNISNDIFLDLEKCSSDVPNQLLRNTVKRVKGVAEKEYHPTIRKFALTLQLCSLKAYNYLRHEFENALPSPRTLRFWCSRLDNKAGFSQQSFNYLERLVKQSDSLWVTVIFDEMKLHTHVAYDGRDFDGLVDVGEELDIPDCLRSEYATDALVFMAVPQKLPWKLPLGFFLINRLTSKGKLSLNHS